jgi:hypothetical protein
MADNRAEVLDTGGFQRLVGVLHDAGRLTRRRSTAIDERFVGRLYDGRPTTYSIEHNGRPFF